MQRYTPSGEEMRFVESDAAGADPSVAGCTRGRRDEMLKRCLHVFSPMATVVCSQSASSGQGFLFLSFTVVSAPISAARLVFATLGDMLNPRGLANSRRCVFLKCASVYERGCRKIEVRYPAFSASVSAADGLFSRQPCVLSLPPGANPSGRSQQRRRPEQ